MILIDTNGSNVLIKDSKTQLMSYQISQIKYLGFYTKQKDVYYYPCPANISQILSEVISYLKKEGVPIILSQSCKKYLDEIAFTLKKFDQIKEIGADYKNGKYNKAKFNDFVSFTSQKIERKLKEHQIKSAFHLYLVENGANFSVPGSGKTSVILTTYAKLKEENKVNTLFVVGPPSCFGPWKFEFKETLGRNPKWKILAGGIKHHRKTEYFVPKSEIAELNLTTYQTLLNDQKEVKSLFNQKGMNVFFVIDEAHYIKQLNGQWASSILDIAEHAKYRCVLTGTPLPRNYSDTFNLFDFLWPHNNPISDNVKIQITLLEQKKNEESAKSILQQSIDPLFYRVRKSDLGLMPAEFHKPIFLKMNQYEKLIYDAVGDRIKIFSREDYLKNADIIQKLKRGRIIRLRQCVSYAKLTNTACLDYNENLVDQQPELAKIITNYDKLEVPAKLTYLINLVKSMNKNKNKILIWANFIETLELIRKHLTKNGFYCKKIEGKTPIEKEEITIEETREKIRNEFMDPKSGLDILIANPAACAESISLHKTCFHAVYYDLSYNCAQYLQSLDRIHRVGGSETNKANYYFLQYQNTIDEDIKRNLDKKAKRMNDLIENDYEIYSLNMFEEDDEVGAYDRLFKKK